MNNELKCDIRVRASLKHKLTNLIKYADTIKALPLHQKPSLTEVQVKLQNYSTLFGEFENIQLKIETSCEETQLTEQYLERDEFDSKFTEVMGFLKEYVSNLQFSQSEFPVNSTSTNNQSDSLQNLFLPKMKIPTFKGEYEEWMEFKISFGSIINSNSISSSHKFQLLRNSVTGYAKRLISAVAIDEEDPCSQAWKILTDKFDKKRLLVNKHIKNLFNLEPIRKETLSGYKTFLDDVSSNITAIENTKISKEDLSSALLIYIISNKLDDRTMRDWKNQDVSEFPTINEFLEFLNTKNDLLEDLNDQQLNSNKRESYYKPSSYNNNNRGYKPPVQVHSTFNKVRCNFCKKSHLIYYCKEFLKLDHAGRLSAVDNLQLCKNCLRLGHTSEACTLGSCKKCHAKHNSLLHIDTSSISTNTVLENKEVDQSVNQASSYVMTPHQIHNSHKINTNNHQVLLSTVTFFVHNVRGEKVSCRALLDSGSQVHLLTEQFTKHLQLPLTNVNLTISGINQTVSNITQKCKIIVFSKYNNFSTTIDCYVVPTISDRIPACKVTFENYNFPNHIQFSDPEFYQPNQIDAIIGSALFWDLITQGKITLGKNLPVIQNTKLGWIVSGPIPKITKNVSCNLSQVILEDYQLQKFWEVEEINKSTPIQSQDETDCENIFRATTFRNEEGRFVVHFPLKHSPILLGNSLSSAKNQFLALERKLSKDPILKTHYSAFIHEYINLGHLSKIEFPIPDSQWCYFLPHHGVIKQESLTTKLRVVFNGSNPSDSGWSLNDLQYVGPKIQNDIFPLLLRFRIYTYVVSADIMKMYRQILIHPNHRPLQLILWRDQPDSELETFQLNTVTYGTTSAPYLAIKCLKELSLSNNDPIVSKIINRDFYVDDLLTGHNDFDTLQNLCKSIYDHLSSAGFILRKWISNHPEILTCLNIHDDPLGILNLSEEQSSKTLGIQWFSKSDLLKYSISKVELSEFVSKRHILSQISQIYDPLGLLSPVIIISKVIIQRLWSLKLAWDDSIPTEYSQQWTAFRNQLVDLNQLNIPRHVVGKNSSPIDLHFFSDASQQAYATCCYIRSQDTEGNITTHLLCSKTRVAPIKTLSIPRLELCAALLSAQLSDQVDKALSLCIPFYFWTDSQIVLAWLKSEPNTLEVFVSNRIAKIQNLTTSSQWYYVSTKQNPADIASRGAMPAALMVNSLWWQGPKFLSESPQPDFKQLFKSETLNHIPEIKQNKQNLFHLHNSETMDDICNRFSNLTRLKRVMALCFRFISKLRFYSHQKQSGNQNAISTLIGPLTIDEINSTYNRLIRLSQLTSFKNDFNNLSQNKCLDKSSKLYRLAPFIDSDGIIRLSGRLKFTSLPLNERQPIILSSNHHLTVLLFKDMHEKLFHSGPQLLLANVRQRYWPIGGRKLAKQIVHTCIKCFKHKPTPYQVPIGNLPNDRITPTYPFQIVGTDYAGPFQMKDKKGRGCKVLKCYVAIFVCFVTKAVHIELLSDMTTECFFACFRRFISRRGLPTKVYSDNSKTFKGAWNELKNISQFLLENQTKISDFATNLNITWNFIPPYSPNFGGLWEAAIKQMKRHLLRVLNNALLTYEEFSTLLYQIEAVLNSRPLYAMSSDPMDLEPLTPSHFLVQRPITALPDYDILPVNPLRLSSFRRVQQLYQSFWARFRTEYITQLHQSYTWTKEATAIIPGALVFIKDKNVPPCMWAMGRITKIFPGKDSSVRVAEIKTAHGTITRSVRHLYPLPLQPSG